MTGSRSLNQQKANRQTPFIQENGLRFATSLSCSTLLDSWELLVTVVTMTHLLVSSRLQEPMLSYLIYFVWYCVRSCSGLTFSVDTNQQNSLPRTDTHICLSEGNSSTCDQIWTDAYQRPTVVLVLNRHTQSWFLQRQLRPLFL
jgi:hypothetical protein